MSRRTLATALVSMVLLAVGLAVVPLATAPAGGRAAPVAAAVERADRPLYRFVAAPDFLNQDVGDVRQLPTWRPGLPNSWTPQLQASIDRVLDEIAARDPGSVLVAGDLVEGHWGRDSERTGLFGPTRTRQQKLRALRRAADFYYRTYERRFATRGLTLHAAVGDHEIGDNPWAGGRATRRFKQRHVDVAKQAFARHFTQVHGRPRYHDRPVGSPWADTAYAVRLAPEVLLVTVDQFHRTRADVRFEVVGRQLAWLRDTLRRARREGVRWIVVQGHNPVLWPVRSRRSSRGHLLGGARSSFWRTLVRFDVDLYLSGEVHDTSRRRAGGVTQVSTGGLLYAGNATYLSVDVHARRLELDVRELSGDVDRELLWQTSGPRTYATTTYDAGSRSVGRMTLRADGRAAQATGKLREYRR